jgi:hypothetical protein
MGKLKDDKQAGKPSHLSKDGSVIACGMLYK